MIVVSVDNLNKIIDSASTIQALIDLWGTDDEQAIIIEDYEAGINFILHEQGYMYFANYIDIHELINNLEVV